MYDAHHVLRLIDDHTLLVLLFGGLSFGCLFVYYGETARLGARHRVAPMTLTAVAAFMPHDGNFVLNYDDWFHGYDHWLLKGFWLALVITTAMEGLFLSQVIRFGREEVAPHLSQPQFMGLCLGSVAGGSALWAVLKANVDDPLYLTTFMLTITWCLPSMTTLYLRRGVRRGISVRQVGAYWGMALGYILLTTVVLDFREAWWLVLCGVTLVWGAALGGLVARAPAWEPEVAGARPRLDERGRGAVPSPLT